MLQTLGRPPIRAPGPSASSPIWGVLDSFLDATLRFASSPHFPLRGIVAEIKQKPRKHADREL